VVFAAPCVVSDDGNRDGLPTVLLEAMALGTPCVSTDVTGIPEVLRDGETGLMVPQHDPGAVAAAIERLLDDRELGIRLAERARRLIEDEFDIDRNAARIRAVFREAVARLDGACLGVKGGV
jgi:colanic acid/amylovoran biosynthesis glycosyltransferase